MRLRSLSAVLVLWCWAAAAPAEVTSNPGVPAFVVDGGTQVRLAGATHLALDCDLRNYATFAPAAGSVVDLRGYGAPLLLGVNAFAGLALNLSGTAALGNPASVALLTLGSGRLSLAGHDLAAAAVSGGSAASYVATPDTAGRLVRAVNGATATFYPVGNGTYDPAWVKTGGATDTYRVAVIDAPPTGILTPSAALARAWALNGTNTPGTNGTCTFTVQWNAAEQGATFDRTLGNTTSAVAWLWQGGNWSPQPGVRATDNGTYPAQDNLATASDGLWTLAGYGALLAVGPPDAAPRTLALAAPSPNPLRGSARLAYGLPVRAHVTLALYSLLGERVATLVDGEQEPGWHAAALDAARLPGGVYFCRLDANGASKTNRVVILK